MIAIETPKCDRCKRFGKTPVLYYESKTIREEVKLKLCYDCSVTCLKRIFLYDNSKFHETVNYCKEVGAYVIEHKLN